jgi:hypothetical protein
MTTLPLVADTKLSRTNPGAASSCAVVHLCDGDESPVGSIVIDVHRDDANNALADIIVAALGGADVAAARLRSAQQDASDAKERAQRMADRMRVAENRLERTLTGRSCVTGEVWVDVAPDGTAWMHDPIKGAAGFGLRWPSLADLWRAHPELRPVRWADGRLICAALALPERATS